MLVATIPLWFVKSVFFPSEQAEHDQTERTPSWVRVVYGILCVLSVVALGLWLCVIIAVCRCNDVTGFGLSSFLAAIPAAIMFCGMAPLAIAYGIGATRAKD